MSTTVLASAVVNVVATGVEKATAGLDAVGKAADKAGNHMAKMLAAEKATGEKRAAMLESMSVLDQRRFLHKEQLDKYIATMTPKEQLAFEESESKRSKTLEGMSALDRQRFLKKEAQEKALLAMTPKQQLAFEAAEKKKEAAALASDKKIHASFSDRLSSMAGKMAQFGAAAGAAGGVLLGYFGTKAMAGTVEAERLSQSIERFFRVTGDALAPYVRQATELVNRLTQAFYTLPASTKTAIVQVALIATGIGMASAAFLALSGVAVTVGGVLLAVFTSPITLIAGLVAAVGGAALAMAGVFDAGISANERITRVVQMLLDAWVGMKSIGNALVDSFRPAFEWISNAFATAFSYILEVLGIKMSKEGDKGITSLTGSFSDFVVTVSGYFYGVKEVWAEVVGGMRSTFESMRNDVSAGLGTINVALGMVTQEEADNLKNSLEKDREDNVKKDQKSIEDLRQKNNAAMDELREKLKKNRGEAEKLAAPLFDAFNTLNNLFNPKGQPGGAGGGFTMKVGIDIGPLESAFSRIQMAVANASGVGVDINKAILGGVEQIAGNVAKIANAPPALAGIVGP